jgi:proton-dependent oligopeptide transporter, POT family
VRVHPIWPFLYSAGLGISFLYYMPTLLALVSRAAPAKVNATLMELTFMTLFISNNLIGWIGSFYEKMRPAQLWAIARGHRRRAAAFLSCYSVVALSRTLYSPL